MGDRKAPTPPPSSTKPAAPPAPPAQALPEDRSAAADPETRHRLTDLEERMIALEQGQRRSAAANPGLGWMRDGAAPAAPAAPPATSPAPGCRFADGPTPINRIWQAVGDHNFGAEVGVEGVTAIDLVQEGGAYGVVQSDGTYGRGAGDLWIMVSGEGGTIFRVLAAHAVIRYADKVPDAVTRV